MQSNFIKKVKQVWINILACSLLLAACNKDLPKPEPIPLPDTAGQSIGELVSTDTNYSFFKAALTKAGMINSLSDKTAVYTVFAPNNNAFRGLLTALGLPPFEATIDALPAATVAGIVSYHVIGGQQLTSAVIPTTFPNVQEPTSLVLQAPFFRMSVFPSKRSTQLFANFIPVTAPDIAVANGVMHGLPGVLVPPDKVIAQIAAADTSLSFFLTAVARADSGQTADLSKFSYLLAYPPTNFTVFAPTNNAFRALLAAYGLPPISAAINFLPVQTVRGIVAYHLLGVRAFSVNMPPTETPVPTLLKIDPLPAFTVAVQNTGTGVTVLGNGNGGFPANVEAANIHAINGVIHKIDMVLLPQ
jgi:uncharacterized surface protein with fasciclin (FAS1) repeats